MHLHNCRCFQEHLRMLLQSLRALCLGAGGSESVSMYIEVLVRSPRVSGIVLATVPDGHLGSGSSSKLNHS